MKGVSVALFACMFLALEAVFSKVLLLELTPLALAALISVSAAIILFFILEGEKKMGEIWKLKRSQFVALLAIGIISGVMAQLLYVTGLRDTTATNAVLLTRLNSMLIAVLGILLIKERPTWNHGVGAALMVIGVLMIATKSFSQELAMMRGDGLLILAAVFWAVANIIMKKYLSDVRPEIIVIGYFGFSGAVLLGICGTQIPAMLSASTVALLTGQVILVGVIGRYLWYYSLEHTTACNVGLASLSMPLFGVVYAVILLGERLMPYQAVGGFLIIAGLAAIEYHEVCHSDAEHRLKRHHPHH
ncbi:MAG: DMT family transporter [Candidatus Altiarchaeota archaeon]